METKLLTSLLYISSFRKRTNMYRYLCKCIFCWLRAGFHNGPYQDVLLSVYALQSTTKKNRKINIIWKLGLFMSLFLCIYTRIVSDETTCKFDCAKWLFYRAIKNMIYICISKYFLLKETLTNDIHM